MSDVRRSIPDPHDFLSGGNLADWIGLVPNQNSSGGNEQLGGITKQGNRYLRQMLILGALPVIRYAERHGTRRPWLVHLMTRRPTKAAAVALANKMTRMVWAIMTSGEAYREPVPRGDPALRRLRARHFDRDHASRKALWPAAHARRTNRSNT